MYISENSLKSKSRIKNKILNIDVNNILLMNIEYCFISRKEVTFKKILLFIILLNLNSLDME